MGKTYCQNPECQKYWNAETPKCSEGELELQECAYYQAVNQARTDRETTSTQLSTRLDAESDTHSTVDAQHASESDLILPWTGNGMGTLDVDFLTAQKYPLVIGVIGQAKAGKTTLLTALYLLLRNGKSIENHLFAGSYTLLGWEQVAHFMSYPHPKKITFPPRTSVKGRMPSLLHLAFKTPNGVHQDILFTDAPGEWFSEWANASGSEGGRGAQWIDEWADAFIVVADSDGLQNLKTRAATRRFLKGIAQRMKPTHQNRPTAFVWAKADAYLDPDLKSKMTEQVKTYFPKVSVYDVEVVNQTETTAVETILKFIFQLLTENHSNRNPMFPIGIQNTSDFFWMMR